MADHEPPSRAALAGLFRARSLALVGASERSFWSNVARANCEAIGFDGKIHLVNPKGGIVYGRPAATSCAAIGEAVDAALLMVPIGAIPDSFADLAAAGIRNAVILTAGFAEMGEAGIARQRDMAELARRSGITLLGPNCLGFLNLLDRVSIWTSTYTGIPPGNVAIVSQSGAVASYLVDHAIQQGIGVGYVVSTGNEADLSAARTIEFLIDDPRIKVVAAFMETARDAQILAAAAERARASEKAIVALKIGSGQLTAAAAQAHTGSLVGDDGVFTAACRRHNIIRVSSIEEMLATAELIARVGAPRRPKLGMLAISGGICEIASDRAEAVGAPLGPFSGATVERLGGLLPDYGTAANPLDVTGAAVGDPGLFGRAVTAVADDPEVGLAVVAFDMPERPEGITYAVLKEIGAGAQLGAAPVVILSTSVRPVSAGMRATADDCGLMFLGHGIHHGLAALANGFRWSRRLGDVVAAPVTGVPASFPHRPKSERETLDHLAALGVPVVPGTIARSEDEAAAAAGGERCAFKIASPDIQHKSDIGGVILDVAGEEAARTAFRTILERVRGRAPEASIDGVLVSPMRPAGLELFVGVLRDPDWGLAIAVGLGGIWVEALKDTSLRLLPVTRDDALAMLGELRASALLDGYRGSPPSDRAAIARAIVAIGDAALAFGPDLASIEVNPLWVRGADVEALDALAIWNGA